MLNQHNSVQVGEIQDTIHFSSASLKEMVSREHPLRSPSWGRLLFLKVPGLDVIVAMMRNSVASFRDVWINDRTNKWILPGNRDKCERGWEEGMNEQSDLLTQEISIERDFYDSEKEKKKRKNFQV